MYNMHIQSVQQFLFPLQCLILCGFLSGAPAVTVPFAVVLLLLVKLINPVAYLIQLLAAKLIPKDGTQIGVNLHAINIQPLVAIATQGGIFLHDGAHDIPFPGLGLQNVFDISPVDTCQQPVGQFGRGGIEPIPRGFR